MKCELREGGHVVPTAAFRIDGSGRWPTLINRWGLSPRRADFKSLEFRPNERPKLGMPSMHAPLQGKRRLRRWERTAATWASGDSRVGSLLIGPAKYQHVAGHEQA